MNKSSQFKYENSIIEKYCNQFNISEKIINQKFNNLCYFKGIGVSNSQKLISNNLFLIELVDKNKDKQLVPTQFFYEFLENQIESNQKLTIPSLKWLNEFLYGKDLPIQHTFRNQKVEKDVTYLLYFENTIVGVGKADRNNNFIFNLENISSFLFEEK